MMNITMTSKTTMTPNTTIYTVTPSPPSVQVSEPFRIALITIYSLVLLVGSAGLTLMMSLLKSNIRSITTIAFLNLIVAHFLFLLTVPFRLYYFTIQKWDLPHALCKAVSAMIHIHMYMVFIIYAIVLTIRFLQYYKKTKRTEFYRRLHALGASAALWFVLLLVMLPTVLTQYGHVEKNQTQKPQLCFNFDDALSKNSIYVLNVILSTVVVVTSCVQTCVQMIILTSLIRKHGRSSHLQQEFWVQMKNLCFVLIMLICLMPYHLFRIHYLKNFKELHNANEVFLAVTGLTCLDMLTFTGRGVCKLCWT